MTESVAALEDKSIAPLTSYRTAFARCLERETLAAAQKEMLV
jgi:hypothetical protein